MKKKITYILLASVLLLNIAFASSSINNKLSASLHQEPNDSNLIH